MPATLPTRLVAFLLYLESMRISLSTYVFTLREEGRIVYVCQPLRGPQVQTRDVLLGNALSKLGNKLRKSINSWIKEGAIQRIQPWLEEPECHAKVESLNLVLRDRTLKLKLLLVSHPSFGRHVVFSPLLPEVVFEVESLKQLDQRAVEVYTDWAQKNLGPKQKAVSEEPIDMWLETLDVTVETDIKTKKKPKNIFAALFGREKMSGSEELHKVGKCLDDLQNDFDPVLHREGLVDEVDHMLQREDRQGVLIVGQRGSGKTAIVQECVKLRAERFRRKRGHKPQVWWLSPQRLISGMSYLGQWEQRWLAILKEATKRDHILYFDDLVGLFSAGRTRDSSLTAADVLRGYLAENRVRILAEATEEQLAILRRRSRALADQLHLVNVPSLSADDSLPVLVESIFDIEAKTNCYFHPEAVPLMLRHQEIFSPDRAFPGKAIDMAKSLAKNLSDSRDSAASVTPYNLHHTEIARIGVNLQFLRGHLSCLEPIRDLLSVSLIGQPAAVNALAKVVVRFSQHLQPNDRPLGVLLFLGPTGVGKTESAKALTRMLYQDESHLVRIDMNELTSAYSAEQLVGTFDQPEGRLTSAVRRQPHCVILLDEIEKAHPDVFDYLLQVLGEGRLTDARGRVADFRSSIIIMTSNLGAQEQGSSVGFDKSAERRSQIYQKAAKAFFRPEFVNRLDQIVAFRNLDRNDMEQIVRLQMRDVLARDGLDRRDAYVNVTNEAVQHVIQSGFDAQLGARAIRRKLEQEIIAPLADCLSGLPIKEPVLVHVGQAQQTESHHLACQVNHLKSLPIAKPRTLVGIEEIIDAGTQLADTYLSRLQDLKAELSEVDQELGEKISDASYYVLREQIHECKERIRLLIQVQQKSREPKLSGASTPMMSRPKRDPLRAHVGVKRALRDWTVQEDMRNTIQENSRYSAEQSAEELAQRAVDAFSLTEAMLGSALEPRNWLFGVHPVTGHSEEQNMVLERENLLEYFAPRSNYDDELLLTRLARCLHHGWQYQVGTEHLPRRFWRASGVGISGLLKPLLGTLCFTGPNQPNQLGILRAIAVEPNASQVDMQFAILSDQIRDENGSLITPPNQTIPSDTIRGTISEETVDHQTGSRVEVKLNSWPAFAKEVPKTATWWNRCLPIPKEFIA